MPNSLKEQLNADVKTALKAKDRARSGCLRLILAGIKQREVDERIELTDDDIIAILAKMAKQRRESITQYEQAGRQDLVDVEAFELEVLREYMPTQLDDAQLAEMIGQAVDECAATSIKDMGKVMGILRGRLQGRADMGTVGAAVKARLSS